jgi:hypothetical protein
LPKRFAYSLAESKSLWLFGVVTLGLVIALGGSIWSALGHCKSCEGVNTALFGLPLGWLGVAFYTVTLCLIIQRVPFVIFLLAFAAGVHAGLITVLIPSKTACLPCFTTAAGAWLAAGCAVIGLRPNLKKWTCIVLGSIVFVSAWTTQYMPAYTRHVRIQATVNDALSLILQENQNRPTSGTAKLIVFERAGCKYCEQLKNDVLPIVSEQYQSILSIETRSTPEMKIVPITIVLGHSKQWTQIGLVGPEKLNEAIGTVIAAD